jgi:hypothetical protein
MNKHDGWCAGDWICQNKQQKQQKTSVKIWKESSRYKQHTTALLSWAFHSQHSCRMVL